MKTAKEIINYFLENPIKGIIITDKETTMRCRWDDEKKKYISSGIKYFHLEKVISVKDKLITIKSTLCIFDIEVSFNIYSKYLLNNSQLFELSKKENQYTNIQLLEDTYYLFEKGKTKLPKVIDFKHNDGSLRSPKRYDFVSYDGTISEVDNDELNNFSYELSEKDLDIISKQNNKPKVCK